MNRKQKIVGGIVSVLIATAAFAAATYDRVSNTLLVGNGAATLKNIIFDTGHGAANSFFAAGSGGTSLQACTNNTHCMTVPFANDTLLGKNTSDLLKNKTLDDTNSAQLKTAQFALEDDSDATKTANFDISGITTGTARTYTLQNASGTLAQLNRTETFTAAQTISTAGSLTLNDTGGNGNVPHGVFFVTATAANQVAVCCDNTSPSPISNACSVGVAAIVTGGGCAAGLTSITDSYPKLVSSIPRGWACSAAGGNPIVYAICMTY